MTTPPSKDARLRAELLQLDAAAGLFELALELVGLVALDAFLDGLGRLVDDRLGFLEAKPGGGAYDLDHLDLLVARRREDHVDRAGLLLAGAVTTACARGCRRSGRDSRG